MADASSMGLSFEAPGKGAWEMDATHCPKPLVGVLQEVFADGLSAGMRRSCERYGMLLDTLVVRYVHGFPYIQPKPVGAPEGATGTPPKLLFKLATWLHPEIRRRLRTSDTVFEVKPWREELDEWDRVIKPRTVAAHRARAERDPRSLDDEELAAELADFVEHARSMVEQDHNYNCTFMIPLGDYLARVGEWTAADGAELMAVLRGHSDASSGDLEERRRFLRVLEEDADARALLFSDRPHADILRELEAHPGEVGDACRDYLLFTGGSELGIDLTAPSVRERPDLVIATLRSLAQSHTPRPNGVKAKEDALRKRVPAGKRADFDELLGDARLVYRLRDERHTYGAIPLLWIGRRLLLEVGRRLAERGDIERAELALHAFSFELADHLRGRARLRAAELERREQHYRELDGWSVPATLGTPGTRPPNDWLPSGARRVADALDAYFRHSGEETPPSEEAGVLRGLGVSQGVCEGTARRCETAADLDRVQAGDILVAQTTTVAINGTLPLLAAIVTDRGGALSHAAIVCREYGIPGVVGTREATKRIEDGARIRVDGTTGTVELL